MEPLYFVIAILGCGEGDAPCRPVRTLAVRYESRAACSAATEAALAANSGADYPVIVAECVAAGAGAKVAAGEVRRPGPGEAKVKVSPLTR